MKLVALWLSGRVAERMQRGVAVSREWRPELEANPWDLPWHPMGQDDDGDEAQAHLGVHMSRSPEVVPPHRTHDCDRSARTLSHFGSRQSGTLQAVRSISLASPAKHSWAAKRPASAASFRRAPAGATYPSAFFDGGAVDSEPPGRARESRRCSATSAPPQGCSRVLGAGGSAGDEVVTAMEAQRQILAAPCAFRPSQQNAAAAPELPSSAVACGVISAARSPSKCVRSSTGRVGAQRRVLQVGPSVAS